MTDEFENVDDSQNFFCKRYLSNKLAVHMILDEKLRNLQTKQKILLGLKIKKQTYCVIIRIHIRNDLFKEGNQSSVFAAPILPLAPRLAKLAAFRWTP